MKINRRLAHQTAFVAACVFALNPTALFAKDSPKPTEERGLIKLVDTSGQQIVVTDQKTKAEGTFKWNDQTKFTEHGKSASASALKAGLPIQIAYAPDVGTPVLKQANVSPGKDKKHKSSTHLFHQKN